MRENFIKKIAIKDLKNCGYIFEIDGLKKFNSISLNKPITFFSGENGTGKSTLLEAIAIQLGFNPEGGSKNFNFSTKSTHSDLYKYITLSKSTRRATDGFFLRAESFYNVATYAEDIGLDFSEYGDKPIHDQSHGESFLNLVNYRFRGNGLYLLDEPEAALSIQRQFALLVAINNLVKEGAQFIIVSHSPVLLAMPNSQIISFDSDTPAEIAYEETSAYETISIFLQNREKMFAHLFKD